MKKLIFSICVLMSVNAFAQNVGVNKTNPAQPLDVNGNVNVDGNLLVNGTAGTPGQVLTTNSSGATSWATGNEFRKIASFTNSGSFTVPAGVTRIYIEALGAGGGGGYYGGGAGGTYIEGVQDVTPGATITITLGVGGAPAPDNIAPAGSGTSTTVTGSGLSMTARGGFGATSNTAGNSAVMLLTNSSYLQHVGGTGNPNTTTYTQKNSTTFVVVTKFGSGGGVWPDYSNRNEGLEVTFTEGSSPLYVGYNGSAIGGSAPGLGGGGGDIGFGQRGGNGMAIIRY